MIPVVWCDVNILFGVVEREQCDALDGTYMFVKGVRQGGCVHANKTVDQ